MDGNGPVETICATVEDYSNDFSLLQQDYLFYLLIELERLVTVEYIKSRLYRYIQKLRLGSSDKIIWNHNMLWKKCKTGSKAIISKRLKFNPNPYENELERKQASEQMITEADFMKNFFQKLSNANKSQSFDAIKSIADLIKSSTDMIELELSSLVSKYNDITADHIRALLTLRGDISSAESKYPFHFRWFKSCIIKIVIIFLSRWCSFQPSKIKWNQTKPFFSQKYN